MRCRDSQAWLSPLLWLPAGSQSDMALEVKLYSPGMQQALNERSLENSHVHPTPLWGRALTSKK